MKTSPFSRLYAICLLACVPVVAGVNTVVAQNTPEKSVEEVDSTLGEPAVTVAHWTSRGKTVRVTLADLRIQLRSAVFQDDHMAVLVEGQEMPVSYDQIQTVEYQGSAWKRGWKVGAAAFGFLGLMSGVVLVHQDDKAGGELLGRTALGVVTGSVFGIIVGSFFHQWNTVYRADE